MDFVTRMGQITGVSIRELSKLGVWWNLFVTVTMLSQQSLECGLIGFDEELALRNCTE